MHPGLYGWPLGWVFRSEFSSASGPDLANEHRAEIRKTLAESTAGVGDCVNFPYEDKSAIPDPRRLTPLLGNACFKRIL